MPVEKRRRAEFFDRLGDLIGPEATGMLFEMVPENIATTADIDALRREMREGFGRVDARFEQVDARFEQVDARFEQVDARFEQVDARFEQVDARLGGMDGRLVGMDGRLVGLESHLDLRFDALRNELVATFEHGLREAVVGQTRIIVFSLVTAFVAVSGLALGAARLI